MMTAVMLMLLFIFKQSLECSFSQICKLNRKRKCIIHIRQRVIYPHIIGLYLLTSDDVRRNRTSDA